MVETLDDERRAREANEARDPEELLHEGPPPEVPEETVLEEGIPTPDVATVVVDHGVPGPDTAVVVDMENPPSEGVDIIDISSPRPAEEASIPGRRRGRRGDGEAKASALSPLVSGPGERFAKRARARDLSRKRKLAYLLSQEVRRVVEELLLRHDLLMDVWSRMRIRQPLLAVVRTRYEELRPDDLLMLPVDCLEHLDRFYRTLDEFRLYLQTTEDMPTALEVAYERFRLALTQISRPLLWHLDDTHHYEDALPAMAPRAGEILEG
jgi:hypothetical protein